MKLGFRNRILVYCTKYVHTFVYNIASNSQKYETMIKTKLISICQTSLFFKIFDNCICNLKDERDALLSSQCTEVVQLFCHYSARKVAQNLIFSVHMFVWHGTQIFKKKKSIRPPLVRK